MDLSTTWLGLRLAHPFLPGASPLADDLDMVRRLEDAGAPAIVLRSLFEEQLEGKENLLQGDDVGSCAEMFLESATFFPRRLSFALGPDEYLAQIQRIRAAVSVPVIASLNGTRPGAWLRYARLLEQAGASAIEVNLYLIPTDPEVTSEKVERRAANVVAALRAAVSIPLGVKITPYFSSLPSFARSLSEAGANGLVLFNRFYQPDFDLDTLDVVPALKLSDPSELLLRLHWLAILSGRVHLPLAVSGGVHSPTGAVKALMAGASAVQVVSALLRGGPGALTALRDGTARWLEEHDYHSLDEMRGSLDFSRCPDPSVLERMNYMRILQAAKRPTG
ncbi:MAG: dihydroorotate dehydrogenase-like protein [Myxococcales bacterium]